MAPINLFLSHVTAEARLADLIEDHVVRDFIGLARVFVSSDQTSVVAGSKWLDEVTSALKEANLHIVLASPDSIERKWINFEAGAAHVRDVRIVPLCHSGLTPAQLPVPLSESQGLVLATEAGFRGFYLGIAHVLGSDVRAVDFASYAREVAAIEADYKNRHDVADAVGSLASSTTVMRDPRALCISSEQFPSLARKTSSHRCSRRFRPTYVTTGSLIRSRRVGHSMTAEWTSFTSPPSYVHGPESLF